MRSLVTISLFAASVLLSGCFQSVLRVRNETGEPLVPYPVVEQPPPPHREADPSGTIAPNTGKRADPHGFNPVYYAENITNEAHANGLALQFSMEEAPYEILYRLIHYKVAPGQEGTDPAKQPIVFKEELVEVQDARVRITVRQAQALVPPPPTWRWTVIIEQQ